MSTAFSGIDIARTGIGFAHYWMDTIAHNLANVNTATDPAADPFRARMVIAREMVGGHFAATGSGVAVSDVVEDDGASTLVFDPDHPLADDDGIVAMPVMDLPGQMTDLIIANRSYQANARAISGAREAYEAALRIGQ